MEPRKLLDILSVAEKLKDATRHCYTSGGRHESVAEHCWRASLMAYFLKDEFPQADMNKVMTMCIIHDLGEAFTGDIPTFDKTKSDEEKEKSLLYDWISSLPDEYAREMLDLYEEMAALETIEARIYKAIDGLEAVIQHNESDIKTWIPYEYELNLTYAADKVKFSPYLSEVGELLKKDTLQKIKKENEESFKVYFDSGFWKHQGKVCADEEISVGRQFQWNAHKWYIPAVYVCHAGLVMDYCIEVEPDQIKQFVDKLETIENCENELSQEELDTLENENPLNVKFYSEVMVNGVGLPRKSGCSISWIPESCRPKGTHIEKECQALLQHYQLNPDKGWVISRCSYAWDFTNKPVWENVNVTLKASEVSVTGCTFQNPQEGAKITVVHPLTKKEHVITIGQVEMHELDTSKLPRKDEYEYPNHYTMLTYTLAPKLPCDEFILYDNKQGDAPKGKRSSDRKSASSIGIIGGADGPTALFVAGKKQEPQIHAACSALYFEEASEVEWKAVFRVKPCEDITITILQ